MSAPGAQAVTLRIEANVFPVAPKASDPRVASRLPSARKQRRSPPPRCGPANAHRSRTRQPAPNGCWLKSQPLLWSPIQMALHLRSRISTSTAMRTAHEL